MKGAGEASDGARWLEAERAELEAVLLTADGVVRDAKRQRAEVARLQGCLRDLRMANAPRTVAADRLRAIVAQREALAAEMRRALRRMRLQWLWLQLRVVVRVILRALPYVLGVVALIAALVLLIANYDLVRAFIEAQLYGAPVSGGATAPAAPAPAGPVTGGGANAPSP
jgi:hypothetical protein